MITKSIGRAAAVSALAAIGIVTLVASGTRGSTTPPSNVGTLTVSIGYGAVASTPYRCDGSVVLTVRPINLTGGAGNGATQSRTVGFGSFSATSGDGPACQISETFGNLTPGTWSVDALSVRCQVTVIANQPSTQRIWFGVCR